MELKSSADKDRLIAAGMPKYCAMITVAALVGTISSFVDGCITGKYLGADAMAAFGTAMPFVLIFIIVGSMVLSTGGSICASRDIGEGKTDKAKSGYTACCMMGLALGAAGFIVCFAFPGALINLTGAEGALAREAVAYLKGFAFGAVPTVILTIMMAYANVDGNEKHSLAAVLIMILSDISLDMLLGVKMQLGLWGMALATSVSYVLAALYFLGVTLSGKSLFTFRMKALKGEMKEIVKFGYPSALNTLLISARCFVMNRILLAIAGSDAVSAYSFQSNFNQFFIVLATGMSTSVSMLTGIFAGEKDKRKIKNTVSFGESTGVIASVAFGLVLFLLAPALADRLMMGTAEALSYSTQALRLFSFSLPLSMLCIILISFYQTIGDRKLANSIAVAHGLLWPLLFAYILSDPLGTTGVWLSAAAAEAMTLCCVLLCSVIRKWKKKTCKSGLVMLDETEFPGEDSVFAAQTVLEQNTMRELGEKLSAFMKEKGISDSTASALLQTLEAVSETDGVIPRRGIIDVQSCAMADGCVLNIRIPGTETDRALGKKNIGSEGVTVSHHCSAGISFVNISATGNRDIGSLRLSKHI